MPSHRLAHEVREDVSRPHHQQQIQQVKSSRPLLAKLHQHSHGRRNISEREHRGRRRGVAAAQFLPTHQNTKSQEGCDRCGESQAVYKDRRGKERLLISDIEGQQQKKDSDEDVSRQPQRLHAVRLRQLKEFMDGKQGYDGRDHCHYRHRRPQNESQHNRNQDDRGRDAFQQGNSSAL